MKYIFLIMVTLISITGINGQSFNYEEAWKKVEDYRNQRFPKKAIQALDEIYKNSNSENRQDQKIKVISYKTGFIQSLEDNESVEYIDYLKKEMDDLKSPEKQIAHLIAFNSYLAYYYKNLYKVNDRTDVQGERSSDINTWSKNDYEDVLLYHLEMSMTDSEALMVPVDRYKDVLNKYNEEGLAARPYVFDFIAHQVINHLNNPLLTGSDFSKVYNNEIYFSDCETFMATEIQGISYKNRILKIYQDLLTIHKNNKNTEAFLDADINRVQYVKSISTLSFEKIDSLYLKGLDDLKECHDYTEARHICDLEIGNYLVSTYDEEKRINRKRKAYELFLSIPKSSSAYSKAQNQINSIKRVNFSATNAEVYTSEEALTFKIQSTNVEELQYEIIEMPAGFNRGAYRNQNELQEYLSKLKVVRNGKIAILRSLIFKSTETKLSTEKLPYGHYGLLLKENKGLYFSQFQVSDLAYAVNREKDIEIIVMDRINGMPIQNVSVDFYSNVYNQSLRRSEKQFLQTLITDDDGSVNYSGGTQRQGIITELRKAKDHLVIGNQYYSNNYPGERSYKDERVIILTDRKIYRPGQTVFYKIIGLSFDKYQVPSLLKKQNITVALNDVNGAEIQKTELVLNDFGSAASSFTLPSGGLTGEFNLLARGQNANGNQNIKVEEYKRPKFKVELDSPLEKYTLGDSIKMMGKATSFTSAPISNGSVSYKVFQSEIRRYYYFRPSSNNNNTMISQGTEKTDEDGSFKIDFPTSGPADQSFEFRIEVDVTDINGETQSNTKSIIVSGKPFFITLNTPTISDVSELKKADFSIKNTEGKELVMASSIRITRLKDPGFIFTEGMPNYIPKGNKEKWILSQWKEDKTIVSNSYNSKEAKEIDFSSLRAGGYKIEILAGNERLIEYIAVTDFNKKEFPFVKELYTRLNKSAYQASESAILNLGTPHKELYIYASVLRKTGSEENKWYKLKNTNNLSININELDYGGVMTNMFYAYKNRFEQLNIKLNVPWTHKDLDISYKTFRNKLLPGSKEKWTINIKSKKDEKKAIELCAALYDMSLDQFALHNWTGNYYPEMYRNQYWSGEGFGKKSGYHIERSYNQVEYLQELLFIYPELTFLSMFSNRNGGVMYKSSPMSQSMESRASGLMTRGNNSMPDTMEDEAIEQADSNSPPYTEEPKDENDAIKNAEELPVIRKNLKETVFFYPQLMTDQEGNVVLEFTMGEALTQWKLLLFGHDKAFNYAFDSKEIVTYKNLMVEPFVPRFLRQGDVMTLSGKVTNLSENTLNVNTSIELINARTDEVLTDLVLTSSNSQKNTLAAKENKELSFDISVPERLTDPIIYRIVSTSDSASDGEEGMLPVISDKIFVTDTKAFALKSNETFDFSFAELSNQGQSLNFTLDYTAHPIWTAIQALPTLSEYPHDCTEQIINKYFAHALGSKILNNVDGMDLVLKQWSLESSQALKSNLEKNQELKTLPIEETPWLQEAKSEAAQKRALVDFLDENKLKYEMNNFLSKIQDRQMPDGGFSWFNGGRSSDFITQYVIESFGKMQALSIAPKEDKRISNVINRAISFSDDQLSRRYNKLVELAEAGKLKLEEDHISYLDIHYLFARSYFKDQIAEKHNVAFKYFEDQAIKYWASKEDYARALIARWTFRLKNSDVYQPILQSFSERMLRSDELGAYWKTNYSYQWYNLPIETHTSLMELYQEVDPNNDAIQEMQLWLLNNKRTNKWTTTKSTTSAIYALLKSKNGSLTEWTNSISAPSLKINKEEVKEQGEAGTGYFKKSFDAGSLTDMMSISITNNNNNIAWGGVYHKYLQDIDKIKFKGDKMFSVIKSLFVKRTENNREILIPVDETKVEIGDEIISRIEIRSDRDMSFIHLKDMRASGLEPINVISNYKWKGGIGYYESTKDLASHFFIDYLPKGTYVFEYALRASHKGSYSNGITTIESMYAPEFSSHSGKSDIMIN